MKRNVALPFVVSYRDDWQLVAAGYETGYSSLYLSNYLFIRLEKFSQKLQSDLLRLYDISLEERERMISEIETSGQLKLEEYYSNSGVS